MSGGFDLKAMTLSPWHERFGARIGKAVLSCSLLLATFAFAADYRDVARRLHQAKSEQAKFKILSRLYEDSSIDDEMRQALNGIVNQESYGPTVKQVEGMVEVRAF